VSNLKTFEVVSLEQSNSATILLHSPHAVLGDDNCPSLKKVLLACHALAESVSPLVNSQVDLELIDPACAVSFILPLDIKLAHSSHISDFLEHSCARTSEHYSCLAECKEYTLFFGVEGRRLYF
jgi:hypothetical protein